MSQSTSHTKVRRTKAKISKYTTNDFDKRRGFVNTLPDRIRAALAVHSSN